VKPAALLFWMEVLATPTLIEFSEKFADLIFQKKRPAIILFHNEEN
jgi:hypothetical protein